MNNFPILSFLTFLPILGMIVVLFLPKKQELSIKVTTLVITGLQLILSIILILNFNYSAGGINDASSFQFIEKFRWIDISGLAWIGKIKIDYFLGVDGLSTPMVLLTAIVTFIATISSWNIDKSIKGYFIMFLLLDTGMMGVFVSLDFFLFYIFWELMLLPMYFLIGIWGGPRR
jgi:NADH-quinone oxidoreductase subunit M